MSERMRGGFSYWCWLVLLCTVVLPVQAQDTAETDKLDKSLSMRALEEQLRPMAHRILNDTSFEYKKELNAVFIRRLKNILERPESWAYPFDSLKTVSIVGPEDQKFRIFTWQIVHQNTTPPVKTQLVMTPDSQFVSIPLETVDQGETKAKPFRFHFYYGLVQIPVKDRSGRVKYKVVELVDKYDFTETIERDVLQPDGWMGALYYKPKLSKFGVLSYKGKYRKFLENGKYRVLKTTYYVLMGWNGHNIGSDYKILDVLTFDPKDPAKIQFGAPIFNFNNTMKSRVVFRYSDNAPFSLNQGYGVKGTKPLVRKQKLITFDNLVPPANARATQLNDLGPDGTVNGLLWLNRVFQAEERKGFFLFVRKIRLYSPGIENRSPKEIERQARAEAERQRKYNLKVQKNKAKPAAE
jgi:hypothetical protein